MSEKTGISWTDATFNPWIGCTQVSPACDHCYAAVSRPAKSLQVSWGAGQTRHRTAASTWAQPVAWNKAHAAFFAQHGRRRRVFCASLADVFDNEVPAEWRHQLFLLIADTPHLDWLLLTKRIGNAHRMVDLTMDAIDRARDAGTTAVVRKPWPWPNVWLGATICNQEEADRDIPKLLAVPARVRFLSIEPMLGPVELQRPMPGPDLDQGGGAKICQPWYIQSGIDWVIAGGESGPGARPMHPDWVRSLRDQCAAAGVAFHFKQWGEWTPGENVERQRGTVDTAFLWDDGWHIYQLNLATDHGHIDDQPDLYRVGKKAAGRLLDGVEHNGFPR